MLLQASKISFLLCVQISKYFKPLTGQTGFYDLFAALMLRCTASIVLVRQVTLLPKQKLDNGVPEPGAWGTNKQKWQQENELESTKGHFTG